MESLVSKIKGLCKNQAIENAKSDSCAAYWFETECLIDYSGFIGKTYNLGGGKEYKPKFDIPDAPCARKLTLQEVPTGKDCLAFANQQLSEHNERCYKRSLQRSSSQNCLITDEWSDCNMDMGLLFIEWSKKCNMSIHKLNAWSLHFNTCPTSSKSVTPNIQKVTEIANKARNFCESQAGTGTKCERENEANRCLGLFKYLENRVYHLENKKTFRYKLELKSDPTCVEENNKCISKVNSLAKSAYESCVEGLKK